jgi:hypothetical protein
VTTDDVGDSVGAVAVVAVGGLVKVAVMSGVTYFLWSVEKR